MTAKLETPPRTELMVARAWEFVDPKALPQREWLYGRNYLRGTLSIMVAAGGSGKSALAIAEAVAMASGKPILGEELLRGHLTVWYINLEDPYEELVRRVAGTCSHYAIESADLDGRLFINSGVSTPVRIARVVSGRLKFDEELLAHLENEIVRKRIDVLILDPFVSSHDVPENDNGFIDAVAKRFAAVAERCDCAISLVHHTKKGGNNFELDAESARGASSLVFAARSVRVQATMTKIEAERAGVGGHERRQYFSVIRDKQNFAAAQNDKSWFRIVSVDLGNDTDGHPGDSVGVPEPWEHPSTAELVSDDWRPKVFEALSRANFAYAPNGRDWVGHAIAQVLGKNPPTVALRRDIRKWVEAEIRAGTLQLVELQCAASRRPRKFVRVAC